MPQEGYWTTNLLDASLAAGDTELTFQVSDRTVSGGRAWARRRYPFRNGQDDEDTGAEPRTLAYTVPLFRDVDEDDYPNLFFDLIELFESDEHLGRATLTDPEFGPLLVRLVDYAWSTDGKQRDGGELKLTFETLGDENATILTVHSGDAADASEDAAAVDDAIADAGQTPVQSASKMKDAGVPLSGTELTVLGLSASFGANVGLVPGVSVDVVSVPGEQSTTSVTSTSGFGASTVEDDDVRLLSALATRFQERITTGVLRTSDEIGAELDVLLARIACVRDDATMTAEQRWPLIRATSRLMTTVRRIAESTFKDLPRVIDYEVTAEQSAVEVAAKLYADPNRAQDIIDLNPSLSPDFYGAGTVLVVPLE